jgi:hypothetical protein
MVLYSNRLKLLFTLKYLILIEVGNSESKKRPPQSYTCEGKLKGSFVEQEKIMVKKQLSKKERKAKN